MDASKMLELTQAALALLRFTFEQAAAARRNGEVTAEEFEQILAEGEISDALIDAKAAALTVDTPAPGTPNPETPGIETPTPETPTHSGGETPTQDT